MFNDVLDQKVREIIYWVHNVAKDECIQRFMPLKQKKLSFDQDYGSKWKTNVG